MADPTGYAPPQVLAGSFGGGISPAIFDMIEQENMGRMYTGQPLIEIPATDDPLQFATMLYFNNPQLALTVAAQSGIPQEALLQNVTTTNAKNQADRRSGQPWLLDTLNETTEDFTENPLGFTGRLAGLLTGVSALTGAAGGGAGASASAGGPATTYPLASGGPITVSPLAGAGGAGTATAAGVGTAGAVSAGTAAAGAGEAVARGLNWSTIVPSLVSGVTGVLGANEQADASQEALALSERMFNTAREDALPRIQTGNRAVGVLDDYLGLTTGTPNRARFTESPSFQYNLEQTQKAGERALGSMGLRQSGAMVKEAQRNASGLASREDSKFIDTLLAAAGLGTTGAAASAAAGANNASIGGNAIQNRGAARSSGYGAVNDAVQGGYANNFLQQYLKRNPVYA